MKKIVKRILITIGTLLLVVILIAGGYLTYLALDYSRIGNVELDIKNNSINKLTKSHVEANSLVISTYNIGFGAYSRDYSFFMDKAEFKEAYQDAQGKVKTVGQYARAISKEAAEKNAKGAFKTIAQNIVPIYGEVDFALYQEVDTKSTRTYKVDQLALGDLAHADYARVFASNYHSSYLMYPFSSPIGASNSGIATYSKYQVKQANRHEFTLADSLFDKLFDLDRAFSVIEIEIDGSDRMLYIFNVHMSAYDASGKIREAQLVDLKEAVNTARHFNNKDNFVIVGGDFNHDLIYSNNLVDINAVTWFNKQELDGFKTDWYNFIKADRTKAEGSDFYNPKTGQIESYKNDLAGTDLRAIGATNLPSARDASIPFTNLGDPNVIDNFMCAIDGFLVSENVFVHNVEVVGSGANAQEENLPVEDIRHGFGFVYSDHNPVLMEFSLIF